MKLYETRKSQGNLQLQSVASGDDSYQDNLDQTPSAYSLPLITANFLSDGHPAPNISIYLNAINDATTTNAAPAGWQQYSQQALTSTGLQGAVYYNPSTKQTIFALLGTVPSGNGSGGVQAADESIMNGQAPTSYTDSINTWIGAVGTELHQSLASRFPLTMPLQRATR